MAKLKELVVKIDADPPIGGAYHLEPRSAIFFTNREFHLIKVETGLRPAEIDGAYANLDPDVLVAFALVALQRAGLDRAEVRQIVWNLAPEATTVEQVIDEEAAEEEAQLPPENALGEQS
jgi:hypothetical protein